uniref:MFS transporter n=1 Tax=Chamaesiphon sp. VAR_48_metabat_135_sub TaxID=2964699 RepID=UPI00286A2698
MLSASWYKIIGLATLQGAISLTWLIYNIYLPKLLVSYGFSPGLAVLLLIVENAIAVILEPLFGSLSDRAYRWLATKFGIISLGVILTSAISISIPAIVIFGDLSGAVKWIIPGILIAWAMAMTVFRTPAISLVGRYAFASELPIAMSFLTLAGGFIAALKPIVQDFILAIGPAFAFAASSIVLLAATGLLRYFDPGMNDDLPVTKRQPIPFANIGLLIGMGWGLAWGSRALFETLPKIIKINLPQFDPTFLMVIISLAIAVSALPAGMFAVKYGNQRAMLIGIVATLIGLLSMVFLPSAIATTIAIVLFICCFSWATNGAIPLAINLFPADRMGLAVGLYFSGVTAGLSSFSSLFNPIANLTPLLGAVCGSIGLIVTGGCV